MLFRDEVVDAQTILELTTAQQPVIPEPMTMPALGMGVAGLGGYVRKRRGAGNIRLNRAFEIGYY